VPDFHDAIPDDWIAPGETTAVDVAGIAVAIANVEGEFFAFGNFCPHQATPLGGLPLMKRCIIACPEHHSMYDVRTGACVLPSDDGYTGTLTMYTTRVVDSVVQVEL
jgi:3-phenylpropionate/trans-cinnamate dioxygenase ferredoxin component